ncbi:uncharacterized protein QC763_500245 [Podospora pseudopauciseta]|uniref:Endo-1,3(4)-beta-glucanase 1 carbohydrate binding domain-containing protein n=2 Tax=Podospora TaxID=5144 RepID=A0ABY6SC44_PODCO|nr:hypothetical protein QC763_500245 [Podospora pseudopauciseta]VBB80942.1 Putative protein of unknown function [Podospora comata]
MAVKRIVAVLALATSFLATSVLGEEQAKCGQASYYPSEYACYDNKTLCPITFSLPTKPCGGGCYSPEQYSCEDETIKDLPEATSPFTLTFSGVRKTFQNLNVKACGRYLAVGANARECHACTAAGGTNCGTYQNSTVLLPGGQMASDVPGHQYWYINPTDGILRYTEALAGNASLWNATIPGKEFAGQNVKVYENGLFTWTREDATTHWWMACLVTLPGGAVGTARSWRIYAPTYVNMERGDCELGRIFSKAVDRKAGVYKYP